MATTTNPDSASTQHEHAKAPISDEDRARLEQRLGHRPERHELEQKNILKPGNLAASLQAARDELQKSQLVDKLEGRLERRPEREDLISRGILKDQRVAPSLQAKRDELERARLGDQLEKDLQSRPPVDALRNKGILPHAQES